MERKATLSSEMVEEFVGQAHGDLNRVQELLNEERALVNACWDWGGGDWETALGAAAHMGRRDIAEFLLSQGARLDIFAAAMLAKLEIVKAILAAYPEMKNAPGPHGIPLIVHAKAGGTAAATVATFLESQQG